MLADTFIFLAVSQFLQTILSHSHCSLHSKNCSRFFKWKTSGWRGGFFYLFLFFFIFIQNLRVVVVVEEAEAELSINFDFFSFHGAKMCCTSISSISIGLNIQ